MRDLSMRGMRRSDVELSVEAKYAPHTRMRRKRDYNCPGRRKKNIVKAKEEKAVKRKSYKWLERSFRSKSVQALCNGAVGDWTTKSPCPYYLLFGMRLFIHRTFHSPYKRATWKERLRAPDGGRARNRARKSPITLICKSSLSVEQARK